LWAYSNEEQADVCVGDCGLRNMGVFIWNRWKVASMHVMMYVHMSICNNWSDFGILIIDANLQTLNFECDVPGFGWSLSSSSSSLSSPCKKILYA
jgi:hypothetical protein